MVGVAVERFSLGVRNPTAFLAGFSVSESDPMLSLIPPVFMAFFQVEANTVA